jgi:TPR repeat protein
MSNLAQFYEHGVVVPRDVAAALALYRRAADGGLAAALADWERLSAASFA